MAIMTNLNNEIGLCHHCQEPIWENESYIQRGSLEGGEIEQYHVPLREPRPFEKKRRLGGSIIPFRLD